MNRRPVPEVRASTFCVTPRPLRVSRTSLPMSCGVYFKSLTSFSKVTVREYYRGFFAKVNIMLPYGIIQYYKPGEKAGIFPYGNKAWSPPSTHSCPTKKKLEALNYPVGMTRLDLTLKITGVDGSESTERPTMESVQGHRHHACAKACDPEGPPLTSSLHTGADLCRYGAPRFGDPGATLVGLAVE
jgi:hypothetical protein